MISCIYIDTEDLVLELDRASESASSALEWVERMRDTLIFGGRRKDPLPFGMHCITVSKGYVANGKIGRWKRNAITELRNRGVDSPDENEITAEIYARHGSEYEEALADIAAASAAKKNGFTADAPHREAGDERQHPSDGELLESDTSATNSGSGSETPGIERTSASLPAPTPSKPAKDSFGEFGNVKLTSDEYSKLLTRVDNAQALIEELDQYIESQGKGKKYKSHYATLLNWSRRKAHEAKQPSRYKNINDINRENCEQIERDLRAMFHPEEVI